MNILVFDTCFDKSYIVLKKDDKILESKILVSTDDNYHSVFLIPEIKNLLCKYNLYIKDLDAIGVDIGPGSFTGIRAGITIARVLCQQFSIKLLGFSSLKILSCLYNTDVIVALDARKNKVYFAKYCNNETVIPPTLIDKNELISNIKNEKIITDESIYDFLAENGINSFNFQKSNINFGIYLAELVSSNINKEDYNWAKIKPLYIQPPSITKVKENNNV